MAKIPLYLFEDPGWRRFGPLTTLRPVWDLRIGLETFLERITRLYDTTPSGYFPRKELYNTVKEANAGSKVGEIKNRPYDRLKADKEVLLVNGRCWKNLDKKGLASAYKWTIWTDGPDVVAARVPNEIARKWLSQDIHDPADYSARTLLAVWGIEKTAPEIRVVEIPGSLVYWPWEMLKLQDEIIREDYKRFGSGKIEGEVEYRTILIEDGNMVIEAGASVDAGAIIDASKGPVIICNKCRIMPGAFVSGPIVINEGSVIRTGAKIYGPSTIGPACKLGGEVEDCIIQGYSNKQHEGFLGHAILGEWINLGADTNNSDLKNNYSNVIISLDGENIDTGETFFGSIIGDHVKTSINTQLNTGTVIGIGSNIFGSGFPPKSVGAYRWGGANGFELYDFDKFLNTARAVVERRDRKLSSLMVALLRENHKKAMKNEI
ncbi:MAG: putative sugar nucleotidyl transferase [Candidatus Electryonea clarkiae]|nr:putative sugar nucleotidyl transferase [Candidatus Electryonea clarkiae]MDP8285353.1 putative sugar nucleotidyl transferase [Candidatus Electryonea clarkiae]